MKDRIFKSLGTGLPIDLVPYLQNKLSERDDIKLYIGTDSQNDGSKTIYASVIVLHYGHNGGHVIYSKSTVPKIRDRYTRLWREVDESVKLAQYLVENNLPNPTWVDLDFNPDPKFGSNDILRTAFGYVESMGFHARCKPNAVSASYVADKICQ